MRCLFIMIVQIFSLSVLSQDFLESKDEILKQRIIKTVNRKAGVAIQKITNTESNETKYELGLFMERFIRNDDDFLNHSNYIVFEDGGSIVLKEEAQMNFFGAGKNNFYIIHELTADELKEFQNKKIAYFKILGYKMSIDKWEKEKLMKTFSEIQGK